MKKCTLSAKAGRIFGRTRRKPGATALPIFRSKATDMMLTRTMLDLLGVKYSIAELRSGSKIIELQKVPGGKIHADSNTIGTFWFFKSEKFRYIGIGPKSTWG